MKGIFTRLSNAGENLLDEIKALLLNPQVIKNLQHVPKQSALEHLKNQSSKNN